jgi:hypothetical protein
LWYVRLPSRGDGEQSHSIGRFFDKVHDARVPGEVGEWRRFICVFASSRCLRAFANAGSLRISNPCLLADVLTPRLDL